MARLDGRVAIVTGGASGIGEATVQRFSDEGARVILTDRDEVAGSLVAGRFENVAFIPHDIRYADQWATVVDDTVRRWGRVDILVNNAGYALPRSIVDTCLTDWKEMFEVNADGAFHGCRSVIPHMTTSGGSIVNVSSMAAEFGDANVLAYSAAKASLHGLMRSLNAYFHDHALPIRCNTVLPCNIETPLLNGMIDGWADEIGMADPRPYRATLGRPVDLANAILFLASDEARYISGQSLLIDGGKCYRSITHKQRMKQMGAAEATATEE